MRAAIRATPSLRRTFHRFGTSARRAAALATEIAERMRRTPGEPKKFLSLLYQRYIFFVEARPRMRFCAMNAWEGRRGVASFILVSRPTSVWIRDINDPVGLKDATVPIALSAKLKFSHLTSEHSGYLFSVFSIHSAVRQAKPPEGPVSAAPAPGLEADPRQAGYPMIERLLQELPESLGLSATSRCRSSPSHHIR